MGAAPALTLGRVEDAELADVGIHRLNFANAVR